MHDHEPGNKRHERSNRVAWLHLYPQVAQHDDVAVVGTRAGLTALRDAIDAVLQPNASSPGVAIVAFARDGESYTAHVNLVDEHTMRTVALPYVSGALRAGVEPHQLPDYQHGPSPRLQLVRTPEGEDLPAPLSCYVPADGEACYLGVNGVVVRVEGDGSRRKLDPRLDLANHSPSGFAWGYAGSGPAQLALAMAADSTGDDALAMRVYQTLKATFIAYLNGDSPLGPIPVSIVRTAAQNIRARELERDAGQTG